MVRFGVVFFLASSGSVKPPDAGKMGLEGNKNMGCLERDRGVCVFFIIYRLYALVSTSSSQNKKKKNEKKRMCAHLYTTRYSRGDILLNRVIFLTLRFPGKSFHFLLAVKQW